MSSYLIYLTFNFYFFYFLFIIIYLLENTSKLF